MATVSEKLLSRWEQDISRAPVAETAIVQRMTRDKVFPQEWTDSREKEAGLYPDIEDPRFSEKLSFKKEFFNARAEPFATGKEKGDPCSLAAFEAFTLSPIQRLVGRFMHPSTPYLGLLLYHGVGVGKTISAISIAENFLAERPTKRVSIIVPRSIAPGFKRTIFDSEVLRPATLDDPGRYVYKGWYSAQATGTTYLKLVNANQMDEKEKITFRIEALKRSRYSIKGYMAFKIAVDKAYKKIPVSVTDPEEIKLKKREILKRLFDNNLIIVDEAHNLRQDPKTMTAEEIAPDETPDVKSIEEGAEAKAIVPLLLEILMYTEGCRFVLMTATPMFNTAPEIIFLLNLLILNDKKQLDLLKADLFDNKGLLKPESEEIIRNVATRYVSYMRGENPFTFPIRLHPDVTDDAPYPRRTALQGGKDIDVPAEVLSGIAALPIQRVRPLAGSICEKVSRFQMNVADAKEDEGEQEGVFDIGRRKNVLDAWAQIGNFTYPNEKFGKEGWEEYFREEKRVVEWRVETSIDDVFGPVALANHGPKMAKIIEAIQTSKGINFVYSRYVQPGALPFCIALERAGYTRVNANGEAFPLLRGSPPVARQCAMCPRKQHGADDQCVGFQPANYVLLTSDYTPNNVGATVTYATTFPEPVGLTARGSRVKVIVGSQIASEGLDLKCVREIHVLDPWYHLNRLEQVIGRGVRYCSHRQLPPEERNCLIHLYSLFFDDYETSDAYSYRLAVQKAKSIGRVQRQLKIGAWDCALNHEGILLTGDIKQHHIDAQGVDLGDIQLADKANSSMCDYQECSFSCRLDISTIREDQLDLSTFTVRDARGYILLRESALRQMFSVQPYWPVSEVRKLYSELPDEVLAQALPTVLNNRSFELRYKGRPGYLILRAGYVLFQPREVTDTSIPLALRYNTVREKLWSTVVRPKQAPFEGLDTRLGRPSNAGTGTVVEEEEEDGNDNTGSVVSAGTTGTMATGLTRGTQQSTGVIESPIQWLDLVTSALQRAEASKISVPDDLKAKMKGLDDLGTIAFRFKNLPETANVLLSFGLDHFYSYAAKQKLYNGFIMNKLPPSLAGFAPAIKRNTFKSADIDGYFLMDIKNNRVDTFCKRTGQRIYTACPSSLAPFVAAATTDESEAAGMAGAPIININSRCGRLFGFMIAKPAAGVLSTKTVENTPGGAASDGADCVGVSNKEPHLLKIQILRNAVEAAGDAELLSIMYPVSAIGKEAKSTARKSFIEETSDMKQQTLCIYLEFICRLMDARRVGGKRWFLNEIEYKRSYDTPGSQWPKGK
jgi:hypothetical protein